MTFKGMLRILINDYRKQHEEKMFSIVHELVKTQRELRQVKEQLHILQRTDTIASSSGNDNILEPTISLYVQYNGFFNQLHDLRQTMTIGELLIQLRQLTGIPIDCPIRLRVLSENGLTTICFLHKKLNRTLQSYNDWLKPRMILSIEDNSDNDIHQKDLNRSGSTTSSDRTYSFDESDV